MSFWSGTPGGFESVSTLTKPQRKFHKTLTNAAMGPGAGGAFGTAADYYRNLLSDNPADLQSMIAPEERRFREQIIPDIGEQFAGMGSGALSSSGFRNAAVGAGTDLAERIASIRANLRAQGAQGLQNIGAQALHPVKENVYFPGTEGFLSQAAPLVGAGVGFLAAGPPGAAVGYQTGQAFRGGPVGKNTSPYGGSGNTQLPAFNPSLRR